MKKYLKFPTLSSSKGCGQWLLSKSNFTSHHQWSVKQWNAARKTVKVKTDEIITVEIVKKKKKVFIWKRGFSLFLFPCLPSVSFCFNLSVHQPFLPIKNISSYFPPILWVYLGLFISVTPFSFITLCQSISLSLSLSLSRPDFSCTLSARDRNQEQHVFSEFHFSLWYQKIPQKIINIS